MPKEEKAAEQPNEESKPEVSGPGETQAEEPKPEEPAGAEATPAPPAEAANEDAWPPAGELTKDEKTMAMLVWLLAIFSGFIGPLIIYMVKKEESKFVAFHGLQALWFGVASVIFAFVIVTPLAFVTCGIGSILVFLPLVVNIMWLIKANNGEWAELPVVGKWARKGL